jgi:hypothetical protein
MLPGSHLRHNPTIAGMDFHLRGNAIGENPNPILHYGGGGLITGGLNPQDFHTSEIIA